MSKISARSRYAIKMNNNDNNNVADNAKDTEATLKIIRTRIASKLVEFSLPRVTSTMSYKKSYTSKATKVSPPTSIIEYCKDICIRFEALEVLTITNVQDHKNNNQMAKKAGGSQRWAAILCRKKISVVLQDENYDKTDELVQYWKDLKI